MILDKLVNQYYKELSENDLHIIKMIHTHISDMKKMKIQELASLSHTSVSSIHRLCRKLGFDGYSELKAYIKINKENNDNVQDLMEILNRDIQQTFNHLKHLDFDNLNQLIDQAPYIYIYGTGAAQVEVASDVQRLFLAIYKKSMLLKNELELERAIEQIHDNELLIIISLSGETRNFEEMIRLIKTRNVKYISVTTLRDNVLAQHAMFNLYVNTTPFTLYNGVENSSFLPYHMVFDVIIRKYSLWKEEIKALE
ncbi:MurR/RpiR family transcriptional regulator [Corticicoccus populi]|uniref:MurR/RpiR family transcriptional regulator n=1 Tax=Corticicoccus populi TaxID=1812821 RepID=A0ABW5WYA4_9STAP